MEHDAAQWQVQARVDKYHARDLHLHGGAELILPYEVYQADGNMLLYIGASSLWERLIGTAVTAFDNTNARLAVGDSSTAVVATQTELQASSNRLVKAMDATYPQHTAGATSTNATIVYKSTFGTADANFAWNEWTIKNNGSFGSGQNLNRKVFSAGTKTSADSWVFTVTLTIA